MELTLYNSYFIFPQITNILTSYIQAEIVVGVSTSYISGDQTYITLLKYFSALSDNITVILFITFLFLVINSKINRLIPFQIFLLRKCEITFSIIVLSQIAIGNP